MRKPTWKTWLTGIVVWTLTYFLSGFLFSGSATPHHRSFAAAFISALSGVSLLYLLALRHWKTNNSR